MGLISGALGLIGNLISTGVTQRQNALNVKNTNAANLEAVKETNQANKDIAAANNELSLNIFNQQMDYTKALQQAEWNRADSSLQRTVADAGLAGLSPLAALGNINPTGNIVSQPSAPN